MRKKRIMIIGPTNSGKTTLANALNGVTGETRKTQNIMYGKHTIDVPGSYIENPSMYKYLISAMQDASHALFLVDQSICKEVYSPGFAKVFACPVIGVITKSDRMPENERECINQLKRAGVEESYIKLDIPGGKGFEELKQKVFHSEEQ